MWSSVAVLALPIALDPVRLGVNLLLISRPRPAQNLLVYWIGCVSASLLLLVVPLLVLHNTAVFASFVHDLANPQTTASLTVRRIEVGVGVVILAVAAVMVLRAVKRRRSVAVEAETDSTTTMSDESSPIARLLNRGRDAPAEGGSLAQRLLGRAHHAWESGALWVAAVIGFWAGPNPSLVTFSLATILASGAAFGAQIGAAIVFIIVSLAVVEIVLICNLVAPARTAAALRRVHDWVGGFRLQIVVAILTLVGLAFVAQGLGLL